MYPISRTATIDYKIDVPISTPLVGPNQSFTLPGVSLRLDVDLGKSDQSVDFVESKIPSNPLSLSRALKACTSLEEKLLLIEKIKEFAMADGEQVLREAGIVGDTIQILSSLDDDLSDSCIELVHILVGSSSEILQDYLDDGLLRVLASLPRTNAFLSEVSVDIIFEILTMCSLPRKDYLDQSLKILTSHLSNQHHLDVIDRVLTVIGFTINSDDMIASLISLSEIPRCLMALMSIDDDVTANTAMALLSSIYKRYPRTPVVGVHKKLDRFLCNKDSRIQQRANELLSLLICRTTFNSFVVRPVSEL